MEQITLNFLVVVTHLTLTKLSNGASTKICHIKYNGQESVKAKTD